MLSDDPDFYVDDGNKKVKHDFINAIQRSVDCGASSQADGTFPPPLGDGGIPSSLPWGGGRIFYFQDTTGVADDADLVISDDLDFQNRVIVVLDAYAQDAAIKIPGGGSEPISASDAYVRWAHISGSSFWSGTGLTAGGPPAVPGTGQYLSWLSHNNATDPDVRGYLYVDHTTHKLMFRNVCGVTIYPVFILLVTDQFPTRT